MTLTTFFMTPLRLFYETVTVPAFKNKLAKSVAMLCDNDSSILDVGCDDGVVSKLIMDLNPSLKIVGVDIQSDRPSRIPKKVYDGKRLPYSDNSFDVVISINVLHHVKDIPSLLKEMTRVSSKHVIIKDFVTYSIFSKIYHCIFDYVTTLAYGIKCVYNFPSYREWNHYFEKSGLKLIKSAKFTFGPKFIHKYYPIFKLTTQRSSENSNK